MVERARNAARSLMNRMGMRAGARYERNLRNRTRVAGAGARAAGSGGRGH